MQCKKIVETRLCYHTIRRKANLSLFISSFRLHTSITYVIDRIESTLTVTIEDTIKLMVLVKMNRMEILDSWSPPLQITPSRCCMFRKHRMRIDARWERATIVATELCVFPEVGMLVTRPPVVEDSATARALEIFHLIFCIKIYSRIEHLRLQGIVKTRYSI